MSEPEVSVVIPAWGAYAGTPLEEALASVREQDAPARVIVVDNASDEPLGSVGDADLIRSPDRLTVGAARNLGLEQVTTPYVLFWDADDLMLPGTVAFLSERIRARPEVVAVAAGVIEGETARRHRWPPRWSARLAAHPRMFAAGHAVWSLFPSTGATIMRTDAVRSAGGYATDVEAGGDWVLGASLAFRGRVELLERPGRVYRRLGGSLWHENRAPARQLARAASVRERLRSDPAIPGWGRASAFALRFLHPVVLLALAPLARRVRSLIR